MKNLWTTIAVNNMEESLTFYRDLLKLDLVKTLKTPQLELAFLGSGETTLELIDYKSSDPVKHTDSVSTGFEVENADAYIAYLKDHGIEVYQGPYEPADHIKYFFIKDPNGYKIQLVENR